MTCLLLHSLQNAALPTLGPAECTPTADRRVVPSTNDSVGPSLNHPPPRRIRVKPPRGWDSYSRPVNSEPEIDESERFHLHFQEGGAIIVRREKDSLEKHCASLVEAMAYIYDLNGDHEVRLRVYDPSGHAVIRREP